MKKNDQCTKYAQEIRDKTREWYLMDSRDSNKKIAVPLTSLDDMEFGEAPRVLSSKEEVMALLNEGAIDNENTVNAILEEIGE